jgi:uncharacterized membrane protein YphA (DoxX/SURF4 family)
MMTLVYALQIIIALGLLNVWLIRSGQATPYRGGNATSMEEEFRVYGFSRWFMLIIGSVKVVMAICLLAGLWYPQLTRAAAAVIVPLMIAAVFMHFKVRDPWPKAAPATAVLLMALLVLISA